ncbi:hypothetical protein [Paraburkholderia megapolitana]|uniref:Uncharacterized protein n=1 Tax=Paraburkholderia megapolitana TaxID=420953 RepID=A0A1I3QP16_9BURK|nr:hypothetical protein [Paraburkholderia megapolitana]QDQ81328.1 hypothetical protein FNZ07_09245 [Paraburkholderia megapolitana]SFJ35530.1 hypothetical protein SAMN05192543_106472 [Paraburkholderia megapolitana]
MNAGNLLTRRKCARIASTDRASLPDRSSGRVGARRVLCLGLAMTLGATIAVHIEAAHAQTPSMLDDKVTQQSVEETICRPGYADTVSPPLDEPMAHKDRLLAARGIDADDGTRYALDRRVPVVLGGSPDAPANLGLLPWAGHHGERRKELLTAKLKRCVCAGKISLSDAQSAIAGNWSAWYQGFADTSCEISREDVATSDSVP